VRRFVTLCLCFLVTSCASSDKHVDDVYALMKQNGYQKTVIQTPSFSLFSASPLSHSVEGVLHVVIEGDGHAWLNRSTLSRDPTPRNAVGLKMAMERDSVYLARPCQYVMSGACGARYWSTDRFAVEVIGAYMEALDQLKARYGADEVHISGFSGGAYVALVLAAERDDVARVDTVAGLLDPDEWTSYHDVSALHVRWSPQDLLMRSAETAFSHSCSYADKVMPCRLTKGFVAKAGALGLPNHSVLTYSGVSHANLWMQLGAS
jgi:pimeloyl-ACP methyl ester carboxylesterase